MTTNVDVDHRPGYQIPGLIYGHKQRHAQHCFTTCTSFNERDLHLIFKVTASRLKLPPYTGFGGGGHLFSLKTLLYFSLVVILKMTSFGALVILSTL